MICQSVKVLCHDMSECKGVMSSYVRVSRCYGIICRSVKVLWHHMSECQGVMASYVGVSMCYYIPFQCVMT